MTDIFFSYSAKDRERVRPVHAALTAMGFDVFWDQAVPTGIDWDTWIRQHLNQSKCAVIFWSANSIASDNVRHEATVAKQHGKLIPVMLEALLADQFPMGLYAIQGANFSAWIGDLADAEWAKFQREIETKLTPKWVRRVTDSLEAELVAERARREAAEHRDKTLRDQIAKEVQGQQVLRQQRDEALEQIEALHARVDALTREREKPDDRSGELAKQVLEAQVQRETLAQQYEYAQQEIAALKDSLAQFGRRDAGPSQPATAPEKHPTTTLRRLGSPSRAVNEDRGRGRAAVFAVVASTTAILMAWLLPRLGLPGKPSLVLVLVATLGVALLIGAPRRGRMTTREIVYYTLGVGLVALITLVA